jgi:hypothetical protein
MFSYNYKHSNKNENNKNDKKDIQNKDSHKLEYNDTHHLNELLKEIMAYHKEDGYEKFEELSMYIKKKMTKLSLQYYIPPYEPKKSIDITSNEEKIYVKYIYKN